MAPLYLDVGVTGTRRGMTTPQREEFERLLDGLIASGTIFFHHGDCVGVDEEAAKIANGKEIRTVSHPPVIPRLRAFCYSDIVLAPKPYSERNKDIIRVSALVIGIPSGPEEEERFSGTWATIRKVRISSDTALIVIDPFGKRSETRRYRGTA